jgi:lactonase family protein with 7-bladed beta-propeller
MSKKLGFVIMLMALCALSVFLVNCGSSSHHPTGVLYVLTEGVTAEGGAAGMGNNISSYAIDLDTGVLTLINYNPSTCPTPATSTNAEPCGIPIGILLDPTGGTAFVLDQGLPTASPPVLPAIYPYTVNSDGSLNGPGTGVNWTTVPDTATAMTRDAAGQFLFVINEGVLPPQAGCPASGAGCPSISVFGTTPGSSTMTLESGSPFYLSKIPSALSALTFTPAGSSTAQEFLFVSNNQDICTTGCVPPSPHNDNTLSVYSVSSSGVLTEQTALGSPYSVPSSDPISVLAVNTNPAGENTGGIFVYVGSYPTNGGALSVYQLCAQTGQANCPVGVALGTLVPSPASPPATGEKPVGLVVDPTENFLFVACELSNQVYGYRINITTGELTVLTPASQPSQGSQPVALAMQGSVNEGGEYLYVSNTNSSNIGGFTVSTTTGTLSSATNVISNPGPSGMTTQQ